jgi:hypothetical protein
MAWLDGIFDMAPLWLIGLALFLLLMLCFRIGLWLRGRGKHSDNRTDDEGYLLSAALALLGLLIAFTFSLALNRYDSRRLLVVQEANAISTAWLRAGLADGENGRTLQQSITRYADLRLRLPKSANAAEAASIEAQSARLQTTLWQEMKADIAVMPAAIATTLITAMNEMFDIAASRKAEREAHIPSDIMAVLVLCASMSATIIGYVLGSTGRSHRTVTTILFTLLTLALLMTIDLDRPWRGAITVSQAPMIDMRAGLH